MSFTPSMRASSALSRSAARCKSRESSPMNRTDMGYPPNTLSSPTLTFSASRMGSRAVLSAALKSAGEYLRASLGIIMMKITTLWPPPQDTTLRTPLS